MSKLALTLIWLVMASVILQGHAARAELPPRVTSPYALGSSSAVRTQEPRAQTGLETGSRRLADLLYSVGARLALSGWEPEIIPYSCVIRISAAPDEIVWYRVSGENLLARKPGPVSTLLVGAVDGVVPRPAPSPSVSSVSPEDMLLYVAQALAENGQEGVAFALVSGSFQGGAGLQSLLRKADIGECQVLVLEGASSPGVTDAFIRTLLPGSRAFTAKTHLVMYPDHDHEAARRYASRLARQLKQGLLTSPSVKTGVESFVLLGGNLHAVKTSFLKWFSLGSVALSFVALLASEAGRSHLAESGGFLTLVSFLSWPLPPLLAPAVYVRLTGGHLMRTGATRVATIIPILVLFSWYLAGKRFDRTSGDLPWTRRKAQRLSASSDPRPFACLFLGGLVVGAVLSLPSGESRVSSVPQYVLALLGFLLSFFVSAFRRRQSGLVEVTLVCIASVPAVVLPDTPWGWMGLQRYVDSLARPDPAALIPFLVASAVAAEVLRTLKLSQGKHTKKIPRYISILASTAIVTALTTLAWILPRPVTEEKVLMERVFSFRCLYETSGTGPVPDIRVDPEVALVRWDPRREDIRQYVDQDEPALGSRVPKSITSFYPIYGELRDFMHRWADLDLSYRVKEVSGGSVVLEVILTTNLLRMPTFLKVTFEDVSLPSLEATSARELQVDGSDFLGILEKVPCEVGRRTSFIRWRPYEPAIKSVFTVYMPPGATVRVSAQSVYAGEAYSISNRDACDDPSISWTTVLSSWEETLEIP